jgi:cysteinyl-tRNA synthetase
VSELYLYNTLTRRKQRFEPLEPGRVRIYSCGPTVYSHPHIANMRPYLFADLLNRTLRMFGYDVRHVLNITDVGHLTDDADAGEDKVERAARETGQSAWEIAERYTRIFQEDLRKLNIRIPDVWCRATDHIPEQIDLIGRLERKGFTYRTGDGIYFDTAKDPHYGELARLSLADQQVQQRIERAGEKRNPADFALWKFSPAEGPRRQMEWDSPWGRGFPGWHIECSAMATRYLGEQFDIHTGGVDHIPVHHTNEIAQSENGYGVRPWVRFWMHEEFLVFQGEKISKSTGGLLTLSDLEAQGIEPLAYRLFFLGAHYRQKQNFSLEAVRGAQASYQRLLRRAAELRARHGAGTVDAAAAPWRARFCAALADDLNAPRALAVVWDALRAEELAEPATTALLAECDAVLGLGLADAELPGAESDARIDALVRERDAARRERQWARADAIREQLAQEGVVLEDAASGTRWRRA